MTILPMPSSRTSLFFSDPEVAADFYGDVLALDVIEGAPCRRVPTHIQIGVIKYDVGTTMLTTHHVESDDKRLRVSTVGTDGVAMAFQVADIAQAVADLSRRGVVFLISPSDSPIGRLARFIDPAGHVLLLREGDPSIGGGGVRPRYSRDVAVPSALDLKDLQPDLAAIAKHEPDDESGRRSKTYGPPPSRRSPTTRPMTSSARRSLRATTMRSPTWFGISPARRPRPWCPSSCPSSGTH